MVWRPLYIMCKIYKSKPIFTLLKSLYIIQSLVYRAHFATTTIASEPMLNEVGALKVHSHLVLGDSRVEFPLTPWLKAI
jgi:hypothetical protein